MFSSNICQLLEYRFHFLNNQDAHHSAYYGGPRLHRKETQAQETQKTAAPKNQAAAQETQEAAAPKNQAAAQKNQNQAAADQ